MGQVAQPIADDLDNGWTPSPVYPQVNTLQPDDATWVSSSANPQGDTFQVKLQGLAWPDPAAPPGSTVLYVRLRDTNAGSSSSSSSSGGGPGPVTISLLQGSTVIATRNVQPGATFANAFLPPLTPQEVALITDYADLHVRVKVGIAVTDACSPCPAAPVQWQVTVAGVTGTCPNGNPCASAANGTYVLTHNGGCYWWGDWGPCIGNVGVVELTVAGDVWTLSFSAAQTSIVYRRTGLNCLGSNVFTLVSANTCANWPATLTLTPV